METRNPPTTFSPVPPPVAPAGGPRRRARRRRTVALVAAAAILVALAWAFLPSADRGLRTVVTETFGDEASTSEVAAGGTSDLPAQDDPRQEDDTIDPFDETHPAISGLDDDLRAALQAAAQDARAAGVDFWVTSGWRSTGYQQSLLDRAVDRYGSLDEARRFVKTPETSEHVSGQAVDIGPTDGADWTIRKGARYGLCQTFANEMWHFELATSPGGECPQPLPDAAG
ncbi:M15 family metallopeptidase [Oerskovia paurometabola]|uniref:M15 family metallopeptidase n=1 Tax=Oerskovia paurometabola TaxID=162170 RepID=A0ABW1X8J3_9CELL|nr:M15 family metallopeptidase [Oerskovia paurometabola]MBM7496028.1 hypothetical protein [Oerskovia paurometabola]